MCYTKLFTFITEKEENRNANMRTQFYCISEIYICIHLMIPVSYNSQNIYRESNIF